MFVVDRGDEDDDDDDEEEDKVLSVLSQVWEKN